MAKVQKYYYKIANNRDYSQSFQLRKSSDLRGSGNTAGQAVKGARGMPWHQEPKKDVTSCDKLGGAANKH